ncbi:MAG: amidohydrolase family protein [Chloroflexi bacterium]|nr:amidohydrolase family protein [Ardenticatenaceae bacterium]MBL1127907.1 hydantoinase [Chloroflexota bacterium]NOG33977.1 amidohydrolase family protein [Chloroflexota bacterium]GIK55662.1 MAG: dihydroorotase-like protein [Chloroflexota bacterium]
MFDLLIKNVNVVRPNQTTVEPLDVAITNGKFARIAPHIEADAARALHDGHGMLAFPGLVDGHMHVGIYAPLAEDAISESKAAAMGGVTSAITYFRTGEYYLNKGGPYRDFFSEVLAISQGRYWVDYAYHLAPINRTHIDEMPLLLEEFGVSSFKIFMFYGGHGLHGKSDQQHNFLQLAPDEKYDFAHFEFIMRQLSHMIAANPAKAPYISLSLHCEIADILNAYTSLVQREGKLRGLHAYNAARPPHSEGLAVFIAAYLAYETNCANINLLHLSSRKAMEAALMMRDLFPHINFRREVTIGHLLLDVDEPNGVLAKVNPPIRPRTDVEFLWQTLLNGDVDWVVSDHACCSAEIKYHAAFPDDIWLAKSGFGGTEYLLSGLHSEGRKRGLSLNRMAELVCWNPAQRYGLLAKGDIAPGYDADLVLFDPNETFVVRAAESVSGQGYTPFEGHTLTGRVKATFVRGHQVFANGSFSDQAVGQYIKRPVL